MTPLRFFRAPKTTIHGFPTVVAHGLLPRVAGLAFITRRASPEAVLFPDRSSYATFGMRFDVDLLFMGRGFRPMIALREVPPNRRIVAPGASHVLVLPSDWDLSVYQP